ncbi:MAG: thiamine pyrophosphate-binding protein [Verrucomicrobiota bacterium]
MSETCGDFLVERLHQWGVRRIFGYPGDGINGIMGALGRAQNNSHVIDFIQARHEEMAAFMAGGHAKFTAEVGVCLATSGPGAIHFLNGLYDAQSDHVPIVAIVGQSSRQAMGGNYQQEVDLLSLFKDVAGEFVQQASHPAQIRHLVDRAMPIAKAERTVTCIIIPNALQEAPAVREPQHAHNTIHSGFDHVTPRVIPADKDLRRAAEVLNDGARVAMLIGARAMQAAKEVLETAEILGAGIAKALLGKAVISDELPFITGSIGLLGTKPTRLEVERATGRALSPSSRPVAVERSNLCVSPISTATLLASPYTTLVTDRVPLGWRSPAPGADAPRCNGQTNAPAHAGRSSRRRSPAHRCLPV